MALSLSSGRINGLFRRRGKDDYLWFVCETCQMDGVAGVNQGAQSNEVVLEAISIGLLQRYHQYEFLINNGRRYGSCQSPFSSLTAEAFASMP